MSSSVGFTGGRQVVEFRPSGDQAWTQQAACAEEGIAPMFPSDGDAAGIEYAKAICSGCLVRSKCLDEALSRNESFGVWGGLDPDERRSMKRQKQNRVNRQKQRDARAAQKQGPALSDLAKASGLTVETV